MTTKKQSALFSVTSTMEDGVNCIAIHRYDDNGDNVGEVELIEYKSDTDPVHEEFTTIEGALADHNIEVEIAEQDGSNFHGKII